MLTIGSNISYCVTYHILRDVVLDVILQSHIVASVLSCVKVHFSVFCLMISVNNYIKYTIINSIGWDVARPLVFLEEGEGLVDYLVGISEHIKQVWKLKVAFKSLTTLRSICSNT